jgi:hypothetical protein
MERRLGTHPLPKCCYITPAGNLRALRSGFGFDSTNFVELGNACPVDHDYLIYVVTPEPPGLSFVQPAHRSYSILRRRS